jgi:predicted kinase
MGSNNSGGLNIDKPLLILVVGNPGSGKSFFARQFSESYKFFYIDTGRYESELEGLGKSNLEISKLAKKLTSATFEQALKSFKHIIFEGYFGSKSEREIILNKAVKAGFGVLTVWVQTDNATTEERAMNRDRRRADDKNSLNLSEDEFSSMLSSFEKPVATKENSIVVSGKHDFKSQSVMVLRKIANIYMKEAQIPNTNPKKRFGL